MPPFSFLNEAIDISTLMLLSVLFVLGGNLVNRKAKLQVYGKRIAGVAFFLFVIIMVSEREPTRPSDWLGIIIRSLIFSGLVLGAAWTILPAGLFVYEHTLGALFRFLDDIERSRQRRLELQRQAREREEREAALEQELRLRNDQRDRERKMQEEQKRLQDEEFERKRPERERLAREAALLAVAEKKLRAEDQKRREDARAACELCYSLAAPEIGNRFSRTEFGDFVSKYMADSFPSEYVEERAVQLKTIIQLHQEKIVPAKKFSSIQDLTGWFEQQKAQIEAIPEAKQRSTLLVHLKERYLEMTDQLLSEMTS